MSFFDNKHEALGLPPNSIRAILAFGFSVAFIAAVFIPVPEFKFNALLNIVIMIISFYVGSKVGPKIGL